MARHPELFYENVSATIRAEYGTPLAARDPGSEGYHAFGPFSYHSYLQYMLQPDSYADAIVVQALSIMWGLRITIVDAVLLSETRYRHTGLLLDADLVVVHVGQHYSGVGE